MLLYKHGIYCLHGVSGHTSADITATDTAIPVHPDVLQDSTITVGAQIRLSERNESDNTHISPILKITVINTYTLTISVDLPVGHDFARESIVNLVPHLAYAWTESPEELTTCPENPSHPVQPGSAVTFEILDPSTQLTLSQVQSEIRSAVLGPVLSYGGLSNDPASTMYLVANSRADAVCSSVVQPWIAHICPCAGLVTFSYSKNSIETHEFVLEKLDPATMVVTNLMNYTLAGRSGVLPSNVNVKAGDLLILRASASTTPPGETIVNLFLRDSSTVINDWEVV